MSVSPNCPDEILLALNEKLPTPLSTADAIRRETSDNTDRIKNIMGRELDEESKQRFLYLQYCVYPTLHLVQVDDIIYLNIENPSPDEIKLMTDDRMMRPCLCVSANSKLGQFLNQHIAWYKRKSDVCDLRC